LELGLKKLMLFRLVMVTTLLLIAAYVESVSETLLAVNPLYFLIGATYFLTVLHGLALRFLPFPRTLVHLQVVGDLLVITGLVYITGGVRAGAGTGGLAGFMLLYPISVLSGSALLHRRGSLLLAGVATLLYAGTLWGVRAGIVPPQGLQDVPTLPAKALLFSIFVTGVACATVALIGAYLSESLRHAGERLEEAAEEVADLRELNEVIVNSIQSGLLTTDAAGHVLYVNAFGEAILAQPGGTVRGRNIREVFGSSFLEPMAMKARVGHRSLARLELEYARPGGTTVDLGITVTPLATGGRPTIGYLLVFQDLTEIKRLEEEVRTNEKLAAVGEMAAQLAHEIRNPLGSISGSAQVLMGGANVSEEHEHLLRIITRESKRLSDTLNRFLFQTKPSGRPRGPVDVGPLVSEAVALLRNGPEVGPRHEVEFETEHGPHVCLVDPDQITQVFWNLARNGLEAMPGGGRLLVRLSRRADDLVFSVRDQGRGMGREEQRRMFEPFHSGTSMGTGLGLAIVYRIVREHGGDITVRSVPGEGTQVEVRLPMVPVAVEA
jgi:two-component system sensor histidine kinase PilS (NtrC family)